MLNTLSRYKWRGIDATGQPTEGVDFARNKAQLNHLLADKNIVLLTSTTLSSRHSAKQFFSVKAQGEFYDQLASLVQQRFPLIDALTLILNSQPNPYSAYYITTLINKIKQGASLSQALSTLQHCDATVLGLIHCGEQASQLDVALKQITSLLKARLRIRSQVSKALFYPCCVLSISLLIITGLMIYVIPQFQQTFSSFGARLPPLTLFVIGISNHMQHQGFVYLITIACSTLAIYCLKQRSTTLQHFLNMLPFCLPIIKSFKKLLSLCQISQVLSFCLHSGMTLPESFEQCANVCNNQRTKSILQKVIASLQQGLDLSSALHNNPFFPEDFCQRISLSIQKQSLSTCLAQLANEYEQQLESKTDQLNQLLEPITMISLSLIIGTIVLAMYMPIFQLGQVI